MRIITQFLYIFKCYLTINENEYILVITSYDDFVKKGVITWHLLT